MNNLRNEYIEIINNEANAVFDMMKERALTFSQQNAIREVYLSLADLLDLIKEQRINAEGINLRVYYEWLHHDNELTKRLKKNETTTRLSMKALQMLLDSLENIMKQFEQLTQEPHK